MDIEYVVRHCENALGGTRVIDSYRFKSVNDAIEFAKKQKDGVFGWWDVVVEW